MIRIMLICLASFLICTAGRAMDQASDKAEIAKVITQMTDGFNAHDGSAAGRMYSDGAHFTSVRGEVMEGREAIQRGLSAIFASRAAKAKLHTVSEDIVFIDPDVAPAYVTNELSGLAKDGQILPPHRESSLRVFVREAGSWKVKALHNTLVQPFQSTQ